MIKNLNIEKIEELKTQGLTFNQIAKYYNCERTAIFNFMKKNNYKYLKVKNNHVFSTIDTEEKAYWLGFLYADGYLNPKNKQIEMSLQKIDEYHIKRFCKFININNPNIKDREVFLKATNKTYISTRFTFSCLQIYNDLIKNGCYPVKSLILTFPTNEIVPQNLKRHFMRGYIDGDGSLINTNSTYCFGFTGTEAFVNEAVEFFNLKRCVLDRSGKAFTWRIADKNLTKQYLKLFYDNANISLDRKYEKYLKMIAV